MYDVDSMYQALNNYNIASEEAIDLVVNINGYSEDTMYDILYAATGLRSFEDLEAEVE